MATFQATVATVLCFGKYYARVTGSTSGGVPSHAQEERTRRCAAHHSQHQLQHRRRCRPWAGPIRACAWWAVLAAPLAWAGQADRMAGLAGKAAAAVAGQPRSRPTQPAARQPRSQKLQRCWPWRSHQATVGLRQGPAYRVPGAGRAEAGRPPPARRRCRPPCALRQAATEPRSRTAIRYCCVRGVCNSRSVSTLPFIRR